MMLEIGKAKHYLPNPKKKVKTMLTAKTKEEYRKVQKYLKHNYTEYKKTNSLIR